MNATRMIDQHVRDAVYQYIRTLGNPGDVVKTSIWRFLVTEFGMTGPAAKRARGIATKQLTADGFVRRQNVRGNLEILR